MSTLVSAVERINDCASVRIGLASPETILQWSSGEVTRPETINYRSHRPERGGLFCERIFGPERDWECGCGKVRGIRHRGMTCEKCLVTVAHSRVRRKRMGHIDLAAPVVHCWFFRNNPCRIAALLGLTRSQLERIVYYQDHVVLDPGPTNWKVGHVLTDEQYRAFVEKNGAVIRVAMGAEAIEELLRKLDLEVLAVELRGELRRNDAKERPSASKRKLLTARLETVEAFRASDNRPEWMVLRRLPVIPPDLRPIVALPGGTFASSDLNDLYRRILARNNRLKRLREMNAPSVILRCEMRLLQQAVDALFDNARNKHPVVGANRRPLKSLTDLLTGKGGRFRENLLGKRVDFSGRSVIVVDPKLKLHQCGLPKKIALELFQPFLIRRMRETGLVVTTKRAMALIRQRDERIWDLLARVMEGHPVLLNRAPTLHRMGIQAFEPLLIEGNAIRLHPMVCKAFNADFDGDQMAVHLPLSVEARVEAKVLMTPMANLRSPAGGQPIISPTQDIVLGCYYLTGEWRVASGEWREKMSCSDPGEVLRAHEHGRLGVHDVIRVSFPTLREVVNGDDSSSLATRHSSLATTVGRVLFNDALPQGMPFYDLPMTAKVLARVVSDCDSRLGRGATVELLDRLKALGFAQATRAGLSFSVDDLRGRINKEAVLRTTEKKVEKVKQAYERGDLTEEERQAKVVDLWTDARAEIGKAVEAAMEPMNPVRLMTQSGARGGREQLLQLAGMRGLIAKPSGEVLERPITSSFREGLSVLEYFSSTHGARKGLADTALKTAEAGYLTRKLVDCVQDVIVRSHDCGTKAGIVKDVESIRGRVAAGAHEVIMDAMARQLEREGVKQLQVRSPLTCQAPRGICQLCYGTDLATGKLVEPGTAVGVIAAQSIGEPGTQLTMRTFHIGGIHSKDDITLGLPRVIELFEAHRPKGAAVLAEVSGKVRLGRGEILVKDVSHEVSEGGRPLVATGAVVRKGEPLTTGPLSPKDVFRLCGIDAARDYLLREIQAVYRAQNVRLDDKHVEIILSRMLGKTLRGITKAAVESESFISAASFQETTRVLTAAALAGKVDRLEGLKENVIAGRLIPAGTGYRDPRDG